MIVLSSKVIHFGFPCITWSRARKKDNLGPPPLRDDDKFLYGFENLNERDEKAVKEGNAMLKIIEGLIELAVLHDVLVILENPASS